MLRPAHWLSCGVIVLASLATVAARQPGPATTPPSLVTEVDRLFARWDTTGLPGCTVALSRDGREILSRAYGMADLEHSVALRPDSLIEAGSVSKQFTAAAVLLLVQQGRIGLDDPVRKYLPELPEYEEPITVRHLLTHTSGLRDWGVVSDVAGWPRTRRAYTHEHVLDIAARQKALNYAPGSDFSYTNTGYNLAAMLVARVSGRSFADFSREMLFEPLGMTRTSWRDDFTRIVRDRAIGYTVDGSTVTTNMPFENVHGNGGLLTTVGDLLRWVENAVHARVGGPAFVTLQHTRGRLTSGEDIVYALGGIYLLDWKGIREVSHSGGTAGYRAWLARYPDQKVAVAVLCNAGDAPAWTLGRQVTDLLLTGQAPTATPIDVSTAALEEIRGLYRNRRTHEALTIPFENGQLRVPGLGALVAIGTDLFQVGTTSIRVAVERDGNRRVRSIHSTVSGETTSFDRVEPWRPSAADLQAYAGTYVSDEAEVTLVVEAGPDGTLVAKRRPATTATLQPTYAEGFSSPMGHIRFLRTGGRVTQLSLGRDRVWDLRFEKR